MDKKLAITISALVHPLLMPSLLFLVLFFNTPPLVNIVNQDVKWALLQLIFFSTLIVPGGLILVFYKFRVIQSLHMPSKEERLVPFLSITLIYALVTFLANLLQSRIDFKIIGILFSITLSSSVLTTITYFWKISAHSVSIGGILGVLMAFAYRTGEVSILYPILLITLLSGLVISARLALKAHTYPELLSGFLLGFLINFCCLLWIF